MTGKRMKQVHQPIEAHIEPEIEQTDTAELEGDNITVKHDFVNFGKALNRSKLTIVDKYGNDVKESMPDWHFAWFTEEDARMMEYIGFQKAHEVHGDQVEAMFQPRHNREDSGHIRYPGGSRDQDLMAYCIPKKRYEAYLDWVQKENVIDPDDLAEIADGTFRKHGEQFADAVVDHPGDGIKEIRTR